MELIEVSRAAAAASIARRHSQLCKFTTQIRQMQEILLHYAGCQPGLAALYRFGRLRAAVGCRDWRLIICRSAMPGSRFELGLSEISQKHLLTYFLILRMQSCRIPDIFKVLLN